MKANIVTLADYCEAVAEIAGRGTIKERTLLGVEIRVPFWRVRRVRDAINLRKSLYVLAIVRPLSFAQHFTLWCVKGEGHG